MSRFRDWWTNANYDRAAMVRFKTERPDWSDLPDDVVARSLDFAAFEVAEAAAEAWGAIKSEVSRLLEGTK